MSTLNIVVCDDCGGRTLPPGPGSVVQEWLDTPELGPDDEDEDDEDDEVSKAVRVAALLLSEAEKVTR